MTLLEQERERAAAASREALAAGALYRFYQKHQDIPSNMANDKLLKEACGDDVTLTSLEFVYAQSTQLRDSLARHPEWQMAEFAADAQKELLGKTAEELRAEGAAKQQERLTLLSKLSQVNLVPAELTRAAFKALSASDMKKAIAKYGSKALNAAWAERE